MEECFRIIIKEIKELRKQCEEDIQSIDRNLKLAREICDRIEADGFYMTDCTMTEASKRRLRTFYGLSPKVKEKPLDDAFFDSL